MRLLILISSLILSGCELKEGEHRAGLALIKERCLDGVIYYKGASGIAPKFNLDGSLVPCGTSKTRVCVDEFDYSKDVPGVPDYDSKRCEGE